MKRKEPVKRGSITDNDGRVPFGFRPSHKPKFTCPHCHNQSYRTNDGKWFRHRMPPMNLGYQMPNVAGPICKMSGKLALKLPDSAFKHNYAAESNGVFLWETCESPPFMRAKTGWKIAGYGKAPWPKKDWPIAVMFERVEPPTSKYGDAGGSECAEGTRIWQHGREEWVPGHAKCEARMGRAALASPEAKK